MYSEKLIQKTRETFEPQYGRKLTQFEVEEIIDNMRVFGNILIDFHISEKKKDGLSKKIDKDNKCGKL